VDKNTQAVLLAGGLGTRIREETSNRPKPMIEIGGKPIIWHLMKSLSVQGVRRFVICTGYRAEVVSDYFTNYFSRNNDFTINLNNSGQIKFHSDSQMVDWEITVAYTGGPDVGTGGRINRIRHYIDTYPFLTTYGDGLSDVSIPSLFDFHNEHGQLCTMTIINPTNRFGIVELNNSQVTSFREKPKLDGWINGGYFLFERELWNYLDDYCTLEENPLQKMSSEMKIQAFKHHGFWHGIDTYRDYENLSNLWAQNAAPWKTWD
jgi:glucose-1-phosphate cytidylyltransferase